MTQTLTITFKFKEEHKPGSDEHLRIILETYLAGKGITLEDKEVWV